MLKGSSVMEFMEEKLLSSLRLPRGSVHNLSDVLFRMPLGIVTLNLILVRIKIFALQSGEALLVSCVLSFNLEFKPLIPSRWLN